MSKKLSIENSKDKFLNVNESSWSIFALTRFLLAVIVLIGHLSIFAPTPTAFKYIERLGGKAAVLGFLLISGISIGHSYIKSNNGYLSRRFLRIYPLYFFAVLFTVYVQFLVGSPFKLFNQTMVAAGWLTSAANFFFLQDFACIAITYNGPLWSLSVEVFLYLLTPIFIRIPLVLLQLITLLSMIIFAFWRKDAFPHGGLALTYAWPWLLGFLMIRGQSAVHTIAFLFIGITIVIISKHITGESLSWLTFLFASTIILVGTQLKPIIDKYARIVFNYLGDMSYPLYLFHYPLYILFYYLGLRNAYYFPLLALLVVIPLYHILDRWLKIIFWKPAVVFINQKISSIISSKSLLN